MKDPNDSLTDPDQHSEQEPDQKPVLKDRAQTEPYEKNSVVQNTKELLESCSWLIFLIALMSLMEFYSEYTVVRLEFQRDEIANGEFWRLLTGNLVHLGFNHFILNMIGIVLFAYLIGPGWMLSNIIWISFSMALFIGVGLFIFSPDTSAYVGFSGTIHGLLFLAPFFSPYYSQLVKFLFLIGLVSKTIWEQTPWYSDGWAQEVIGAEVAVNSHALGLIAGMILTLVFYGVNRLRPKFRMGWIW